MAACISPVSVCRRRHVCACLVASLVVLCALSSARSLLRSPRPLLLSSPQTFGSASAEARRHADLYKFGVRQQVESQVLSAIAVPGSDPPRIATGRKPRISVLLPAEYDSYVPGSFVSCSQSPFVPGLISNKTHCAALADLFAGAGGSGWIDTGGWADVMENCCFACGVSCNSQGNVVSVVLQNNGLTGTIPASIGVIESLQTLTLSQGQLLGWPPQTLARLKNLTTLSLEANSLSGPFPSQVCGLGSMRILNLGGNSFAQDLSNSCVWSMLSLNVLYLYGNGFSGPLFPQFTGLKNLQIADVGVNLFTGGITPGIAMLSGMQFLDVSTNQLGGSIPDCFCGMPSLMVLELDRNRFWGSLPLSFSCLSNLTVLSISTNNFSSPLFLNATGLTSLEFLFASGNLLTQVPPEVSEMPSLTGLVLQGNRIRSLNVSVVMPSPAKMTGTPIRILDLSLNQIVMPWPPEFFDSAAPFLVLDLSNNFFYGPNPFSDLCRLQDSEMIALMLDGNSMDSMDIIHNPACSWPSLMMLQLSGCNMSGTVSGWIFEFVGLHHLDLSNNNLVGNLLALQKLSGLNTFVDVSGNPGLVESVSFPRSTFLPGEVFLSESCFQVLDEVHRSQLTENAPFLCHDVNLRDSNAQLSIDDSYFHYRFCYCDSPYYGMPPNCRRCPEHGFCPDGNLYAVSGWWASPDVSYLQQRLDAAYPLAFLPCISYGTDTPCHVDDVLLNNKCSEGYTGRVCSACASGYFALQRYLCARCPSSPFLYAMYLLAIASAILLLILASFFIGKASSGSFKTLTFFVQARRFLSLPFISGGLGLLNTGLEDVFTFRISSPECVFGDSWDFVAEYTIAILMPMILSVVVGGIYCAGLAILPFWERRHSRSRSASFGGGSRSGRGASISSRTAETHEQLPLTPTVPLLFADGETGHQSSPKSVSSLTADGHHGSNSNSNSNSNSGAVEGLDSGLHSMAFRTRSASVQASPRQRWRQRCLVAWLFLLYVAYFSVSQYIMLPLPCGRDPGTGERYNLNMPYRSCEGSLVTASSCLFVLWVVMAPVSYFWWAFRRTAKSSAVNKVLMASYMPAFRFWEIVVTSRRVLLLVAFLILDTDNVFTTVFTTAILAVSLALQVRFQPFSSRIENSLETTSLILLSVNYAALLKSNAYTASDIDAVAGVFFTINTLFIVGVFGIGVRYSSLAQRVFGKMSAVFGRRRTQPESHSGYEVHPAHGIVN